MILSVFKEFYNMFSSPLKAFMKTYEAPQRSVKIKIIKDKLSNSSKELVSGFHNRVKEE